MKLIPIFSMMLAAHLCHAECVLNAKSKVSFQVIDSHTIMLTGGLGKGIIIKTFAFLTSVSKVTVLKDDFCDYESAVLYVDGEVIDVQQVKSF